MSPVSRLRSVNRMCRYSSLVHSSLRFTKSIGFRGVRQLCILILVCSTASVYSWAQIFTTVLSFNASNGSQPNGPLALGLDGNLYGTTATGGSQGRGSVFKITPTRTLTRLYSFCSLAKCADGGVPNAGLVLGRDGNLYGTTTYGGARNVGTIFKISPQGVLTTLHNFCGTTCGEGYGTDQPLIEAANGSFYGAAPSGGFNQGGTIFKITPTGKFALLYSFCSEAGCADGSAPNGLVQATDGNFYGTTVSTVFRFTPNGTLRTLHRFCGKTTCSGGYSSAAALMQASDGVLYGTTQYSVGSARGTVFKITLQGAFTTIHRFCTNTDCLDGAFPRSKLVQGTDGNLYGTTTARNTKTGGTLFKLTRTGTLTVLHTFPTWRIDAPGVIQSTDGNFYGTTQDVSASFYGSIFKLSMGFGPFIEPLPIAGAVKASVVILGANLSGTTAVNFNGTAALFSELSNSSLSTVVPVGATTGKVTVLTPKGTLTSNTTFQVR